MQRGHYGNSGRCQHRRHHGTRVRTMVLEYVHWYLCHTMHGTRVPVVLECTYHYMVPYGTRVRTFKSEKEDLERPSWLAGYGIHSTGMAGRS